MKDFEAAMLSFVIRLWAEEVDEASPFMWRGHITHIPSNNRRYVQDVDGICTFVESHLDVMEAKLTKKRRNR